MADDHEIHSFAHCRTCVLGGQTQRLECGISRTGFVVRCKKHGLVWHLSPGQLSAEIAKGPQCACCPGGMHRS